MDKASKKILKLIQILMKIQMHPKINSVLGIMENNLKIQKILIKNMNLFLMNNKLNRKVKIQVKQLQII
jgi:hypothetical protein